VIVTSITQLKAHLSESLRKVRAGETFEITDRNTAIVCILPLEAQTLVDRPPLQPFNPVKPRLSKVVDAQGLLDEERGSR
jgi:prevent-host-death family protein